MAFNNTLTVLDMTGVQVLAAMEHSLSRATNDDGQFPQVAGMVLEFGATQDPIEAVTGTKSEYYQV